MLQLLNPKTILAPNGTYSHGVLVTGVSKFLAISGQVAIKSDGTVPDSLNEQCEVIWKNILAILDESGMSIKNLIKINSYLTSPQQIKTFVEIRANYLQGHCPASTLVVVSALADPRFLVEIEGYALIS
jgi:enamine deaminase RidA (YjgF/YER057c/UK114 family)